jgi:hypothetical protein
LIDIDLKVDIDFALLDAGAAGLRVAGLEEGVEQKTSDG